MTTVLLVRHGESAWNAEGRIQGHLNSDLSPVGQAQALAVRERLQTLPIAAIYSSDLLRAIDTITPTAEALGLPVLTRTALREKSFGEWEGLTPAEVEERFPGMWTAYRSEHGRHPHFVVPGGETWTDVYERMNGVVAEVAATHPDETVVITGHGGSLRTIVLQALGAPLSSLFRISMDNAAVTRIHYRNADDARLVLLNDTSHLQSIATATAAQLEGLVLR